MAPKSVSPNPGLSRKVIVTRAIETVDRGGLATLSMRRLAADLSVTPMALYWHFKNKRALLDAMAEQVATEFRIEDSRNAPWQERLRHVLLTILESFRAHPWLPGLVKGRVVAAPEYLHTVEALLDAIRSAGYDEHEAVRAADFAIDCIGSMAATIALYSDDDCLPSRPQLEQERRRIEAVATGGYPRIGEAAVPLTEPDEPQDYIALGIEILVRGIEAASPAAGRPTA